MEIDAGGWRGASRVLTAVPARWTVQIRLRHTAWTSSPDSLQGVPGAWPCHMVTGPGTGESPLPGPLITPVPAQWWPVCLLVTYCGHTLTTPGIILMRRGRYVSGVYLTGTHGLIRRRRKVHTLGVHMVLLLTAWTKMLIMLLSVRGIQGWPLGHADNQY